MTYQEFLLLHSDTIRCFQLIEHDLKGIYAFMQQGDVDENFESLSKKNLGYVLKSLKKLDYSDGDPFLSPEDYNFLNQMRDKRNYWCHQCFVEFVYLPNFESSSNFRKVFSKLHRDHDRLVIVQKNVERVRIEAAEAYR